jgi:DNA mismatch repair protein MutS
MFATHLHELYKLKEMQELKECKVFHLHTYFDQQSGELVYDRKLRPGPTEELYGIEVAKAMLSDDTDFIKDANKIRDSLTGAAESVQSSKSSHYNADQYMHSCDVCGSTEKLEVHHINEQKTADKNGRIGHFHKNNKANLTTLCWNCHHKDIPSGKLVIRGWKMSIKKGLYLDYSRVE